MAYTGSPYQPPPHIVQLSIQQMDICATPHSAPAPETRYSYAAPTVLYPQSTAPKDSAVREKHIQEKFMINLAQYRETSIAQPAKEKALEAPKAKQYDQDNANLQLHQEELTRHSEISSTTKTHHTRDEEHEGRFHKGKERKQRSKANEHSMRSQKRRSSGKGSIHRKKGKESERRKNDSDRVEVGY